MALERRGISLKLHAVRQDPDSGRLPVYHVFLGAGEHWFTDREELDAFVKEQEEASGGELVVDAGTAGLGTPEANSEDAGTPDGETNGAPSARLRIVELHEVRTINNLLGDLREMGFEIEALIPQERTGEEGSRFTLRRGDNETGLEDLTRSAGGYSQRGRKRPANHPL